MRTIAIAFAVVGGIGLLCGQSTKAMPTAAGSAIKEALTAAAQPVQYREHITRHYIVKCYRDLVFGPYRCHRYRRSW